MSDRTQRTAKRRLTKQALLNSDLFCRIQPDNLEWARSIGSQKYGSMSYYINALICKERNIEAPEKYRCHWEIGGKRRYKKRERKKRGPYKPRAPKNSKQENKEQVAILDVMEFYE